MAGICLVGAAVLMSLLAAAVCGRWVLRGAAAVRPYLLAFLVFAAVAMNFAQKSGTNRVAVAEAGECNMSFDYNGSTCTFPIRVVAPKGVAGTFGALRPLLIGAENIVDGYDHARTDLLDLPVEDGGYHMDIPLKWGIDGGPYTHDAGLVVQTISVQTNGTVSVSKFGITARRKPNEDYQ